MQLIRTKDGRIVRLKSKASYNFVIENTDVYLVSGKHRSLYVQGIVKQAYNIEDLIQIGDIVFYWQQSDDKEHCSLIVYDTDISTIKYNAITKLLIPVGDDYKCVAKGYPTFEVIRNRRYLIDKGRLELL